MLDMRMTVKYTDGRSQPVKIRPVDSVSFEEKYDMAITEAFAQETKTRLSHIYFLAYSASMSTLEFKEWLTAVDEIEVDVVADAAPLDPAAKNGSTPPLLSLPESLPAS